MIHPATAILIKNIRRTADERGIKHCKLAEKIGVSRETFSRMLSGQRKIEAWHVWVIARELGVTPNDLY